MLIFHVFAEVDGVHAEGICRKFASYASILLQTAPNGLIDLLIADLWAIGDRSMQVVCLRGTSLHEKEGNVGDSAIVCEVFKGIRPHQDTKSPQQFEDESYSQEYCACDEIEKQPVDRSEWLPSDSGRGGLCSLRFPSDASHEEQYNCQHPKDWHSSMSIELCKWVYNKYFSPAVLELIALPVYHKNLSAKLFSLVHHYPNQS